MSRDIIYREDAIKAINLRARIPHDVVSALYASMAINAICSVPSVDRLRGEWVEDPINENIRRCSNCKASYTKDFLKSMTLYAEPKEVPNYCPNCGAKMKGAENNKECHKPESLYYRAFYEERKDSAYCDGCEFWH